MTYTICHEAKKGYIYIVLDVINKESMRVEIPKILELMKENNCYALLSDCRNSTMPMDPLGIMDLPSMWTNAFLSSGISPSKPKGAIFLHKNRKLYANLHFFETVSFNRNLKVKTFFDLSAATNWLVTG